VVTAGVRTAEAGDAEAVAELAAGLAHSFPFSRARFGLQLGKEESAAYLRKIIDDHADR
jgi:hypothetical protein